MSGLRTFMGILGTLCLFAFIGIIIGGLCALAALLK